MKRFIGDLPSPSLAGCCLHASRSGHPRRPARGEALFRAYRVRARACPLARALRGGAVRAPDCARARARRRAHAPRLFLGCFFRAGANRDGTQPRADAASLASAPIWLSISGSQAVLGFITKFRERHAASSLAPPLSDAPHSGVGDGIGNRRQAHPSRGPAIAVRPDASIRNPPCRGVDRDHARRPVLISSRSPSQPDPRICRASSILNGPAATRRKAKLTASRFVLRR